MNLTEALNAAKGIQLLEFMALGRTRPEYHFEGREIDSDSVTKEQNDALNQAEVFLCHKNGGVYMVLRDAFGKGRETRLDETTTVVQ
jgi:hypothetical protein